MLICFKDWGQTSSTGPDVAKLKQRMYELGYFKTNTVNEIYSAATAEYVMEFEKANDLLADGIADSEMQTLFYSDAAVLKPRYEETAC